MRLATIIVVLLIVLVYYLYTVKSSFKVSFKIDDIGLKDFSLANLNSGRSFVQTKIQFFVLYKALFRIVFSDLYLEAYYNNILVAKSSNIAENFKTTVLLPDVTNTLFQTFDLSINSSAVDLVYKIKTEQKYSVDYLLRVKLFGIQINLNNTYTN